MKQNNIPSDPHSTNEAVLFRYYAVRVGYARASYFHRDEDGFETRQEVRRCDGIETAPMVKIRSAIFLYWDDACQFVERHVEHLDRDDSSWEFQVEYEGFDSIEEAEVSDRRSRCRHEA